MSYDCEEHGYSSDTDPCPFHGDPPEAGSSNALFAEFRARVRELDDLSYELLGHPKSEYLGCLIETLKLWGCAADGHEWELDQCGYWQHQYCLHCSEPKYPDMAKQRCGELYEEMGTMTEKEFLSSSGHGQPLETIRGRSAAPRSPTLATGPDRQTEQMHGLTGIFIRAKGTDGKYDAFDLAELDAPSLTAFLKSEGGDNRIAENVVRTMLGHVQDTSLHREDLCGGLAKAVEGLYEAKRAAKACGFAATEQEIAETIDDVDKQWIQARSILKNHE